MLPLKEMEISTLVVGTGAAGFQAAVRLSQLGEEHVAILAEDVSAGTSRNAGSDKQTYYKLSLAGGAPDSVRSMAEDLFRGRCVDGDLALCEAALSARCFYRLVELGVPFPDDDYGEAVGYRTDHDSRGRASSVGPYTSKIMTECLEREAVRRQIRILDRTQMIRILVDGGRVRGVLCLRLGGKPEFLLVWCRALVLATGGPAGMYRDSVYPVSQHGSSGLAFEAGVRGQNLTEWQFGLASLKPRWNVSGTYMQAIPRFISTDRDGGGEREFLLDHFGDPVRTQFLTFLKGYQWPFDTAKLGGGSSLIDLLVYQETVMKGRRVFLDLRRDPGGTLRPELLPEEAYSYLKTAGACLGTPVERLRHMNEPAFRFYLDHGVDLRRDRLEIAVCAQHNNGGLAVDRDWQTNIPGIYAVGEAAGTHGVARPGGSALNAGQVGALRAAEHIVRHPAGTAPEDGSRERCRRLAGERIALLRTGEGIAPDELWDRAAARMSRCGGMIRSEALLRQAAEEVERELAAFPDTVRVSGMEQAGRLYQLYDMLLSQRVYLAAMLDYVRHGGGSRGSALYTCPEGDLPEEGLPELFRSRPDGGALDGMVQEIALGPEGCRTSWRPVRPVPEPDGAFETQWRAYRRRWGQSL